MFLCVHVWIMQKLANETVLTCTQPITLQVAQRIYQTEDCSSLNINCNGRLSTLFWNQCTHEWVMERLDMRGPIVAQESLPRTKLRPVSGCCLYLFIVAMRIQRDYEWLMQVWRVISSFICKFFWISFLNKSEWVLNYTIFCFFMVCLRFSPHTHSLLYLSKFYHHSLPQVQNILQCYRQECLLWKCSE